MFVITEAPRWMRWAAAIFALVFVFNWPNTSGEWAAWVQAVGSVTAVASGVVLIRHQIQSRKDLEYEKENQRRIRLIKNLKTEIRVNWNMLSQNWGSFIEGSAEGTGEVRLYMNTKGWPFPVYDSSAADLGLIESEEDRDLLIATYAAARGFLLTMEINNELLMRSDALTRELYSVRASNPGQAPLLQSFAQEAGSNFSEYGQHVRDKYEELRSLVAKTLEIEAV